MNRIAVVGSLNMDLSITVSELPHAGETRLGGSFRTLHGGKGANQAVAAARAGSRVAMIGRVGDDSHGAALRQALSSAGVQTDQISVSRATPTGVALIMVDTEGENLIAVAPGANSELCTADVTAASAVLTAADMVVAQLEVPLEAVQAAAQLGRAFLLNAAPPRQGLDEVLASTTILIVNRGELEALAGRSEVLAAARSLVARGPKLVVITLGAEGAVAVTAEAHHAQSGFSVDAVDATGAGDAFVGAFATTYRGIESLESSLAWGCAAGALACTRHGAQEALPQRDEIEMLINEGRIQGC